MPLLSRAVITATLGLLLVLATTATATARARPGKAAKPRATPTCAGRTPPADSSGRPWRCSFSDEFDASTGDATALNRASWVPQETATSGYATGPVDAFACYVDSTDNVSVSDGALHLTVRKEAAPFACGSVTTQYTSGMVSTSTKFAQTYGRFEVRARLPQTILPGLQSTLWLYPQNLTYGPWPGSGEVDFGEFYSLYSLLAVPFVHYDYDPLLTDVLTGHNVTTATCPIDPAQYNTYAVVWEPGTFTITINGATCLVNHYEAKGLAAPAPFDQPFFIALTQALGIGTNEYSPLLTPLPATMSIDYVRAWTNTDPPPEPPAAAPESGDRGDDDARGGSDAPGTDEPLEITEVGQAKPDWRTSDGTSFTYTLNQPAKIKLVFRRITGGRKVKGRCVKTERRSGRRCDISTRVGEMTVAKSRTGRNKVSFGGRLTGGRRLSPGTYTVTVTAGKTTSEPLRFRIKGR